jgi:hypothetical protein
MDPLSLHSKSGQPNGAGSAPPDSSGGLVALGHRRVGWTRRLLHFLPTASVTQGRGGDPLSFSAASCGVSMAF